MEKKFYIEDVSASLIVFLVALPLCIGVAIAIGAPPVSGLIAGVIGGVVTGIISNSALGVSGPTPALVAICISAVSTLGNLNDLFLSVALAGIIQIALGLLRLGKLSYFFPLSVIKGMLTSIGIIIILKQIPHAFGYDADFEGDLSFFQKDGQNTISELVSFWKFINPISTIVFFSGILILFIWEKFLSKKLPKFTKIIQYPLAIVLFGVFLVLITQHFYPNLITKDHLVFVPSFSDLISSLKLIEWNNIHNKSIWYFAFAIALGSSIETLLCVEAIDSVDPKKRMTNRNRELVAQGVGNFLSGLIGGLPNAQVIVRSSTNLNFNAQTKLSNIFHGVWIGLSIILLYSFLNLIPLAALATILIIVGYKLAHPNNFINMYKKGIGQFIAFTLTIIAIVSTDLLIGILIGLLSGIIIEFYYNAKDSVKVLKSNEESDKLTVYIDKKANFMNKNNLVNIFNSVDNTIKTINVIYDGNNDDITEILNYQKNYFLEKNINFNIISNLNSDKLEVLHSSTSAIK
jgi:MFS superfamily sulfate permease-like transporter